MQSQTAWPTSVPLMRTSVPLASMEGGAAAAVEIVAARPSTATTTSEDARAMVVRNGGRVARVVEAAVATTREDARDMVRNGGRVGTTLTQRCVKGVAFCFFFSHLHRMAGGPQT